MYMGIIGFLITFISGYSISIVIRLLNKQGKEKIYLDDTKKLINPELFFPPKAKYIRRRNLKFEENADRPEKGDENEKF